MHRRPNRLRWRTRAARLMLVLATIVVVLGAQVTRIVAAGLQYGSMQCCCGVHQSDEECGCPDCPAAHSGAKAHDDHNGSNDHDANQAASGDRKKQTPNPPSLNRCGPTATVVALMADAPWLPSLVVYDVATFAMRVSAPPPPAMMSTLRRAPDAPPPRWI